MSLVVRSSSAKFWLVLVGVTQYQDSQITHLSYCANDCRSLAEALETATQDFRATEIIAHYDGASQLPELNSISSSLEQLRNAKPEDTVLFYFSGHGFLDKNNRPILCVADTQLEDLSGTGLQLDTILQELKRCPAKKQVVWLDACQTKIKVSTKENPNAQLLQALKEQAEQSHNFSAILSCDRHERSWEIPELGHGLFTYYLIQGLRGKAADPEGIIEVKELFKYVRDRLKQYLDNWNSPQHPETTRVKSDKGIVINPTPLKRSQTPQQIFRGSADIVLGRAVNHTQREALVIKTLAFSESTVNLCQILQGKGGFTVDYCFPEAKQEEELETAIASCLQSERSKTVLLYLAGKIVETDKNVYQLWLNDSAYITFNWLKSQLDKSPIDSKIVIIDGYGTNNLDNCLNILQPNAQNNQSIIAATVEAVNQGKFIAQLLAILQTAADFEREFWVAELITQLQKARQLNPEIVLQSWLSGATEVLDILLPQGSRKPVIFDANYCPYKGLLAFTKQDSNFFYGREALTQEIVSQLKNTSFLAILGASGSGKSSVVQAGVLPQLETKGLYCARSNQLQLCQTWVMRPGDNPIEALAKSIAPHDLEVVEGIIHAGVEAFIPWLQQQSKPLSVLVIDQFEELFTLTPDSDRHEFLDFILSLSDRVSDCFKVMITLRDDFTQECAEFPQLAKKIQQSYILVLSYFTEDQYRQIITQPARQVGLTVEEALVKVLVEEVQTGSLPLLQFALEELWRKRTPGSLTLQDYQQHIGGIAKILEEKADLTYQSLSKAQQECAQWIFLSLVQLGEGKEDTRRPMLRSQLLVSKYDKDKASRQLFQSTLHALTEARLIVVSWGENNIPVDAIDSQERSLNSEEASQKLPISSNSDVTVEVIHEILIRNWQTLRWWLDKNRARLRLTREIEQEAHKWQQNQKNHDYLLRGTALARAEELYINNADDLSNLGNQYVYQCIENRDRQEKINRRNRFLITGSLATGFTIVSLLAVGLRSQLRQATINEINALSNSAEALLSSDRELDALVTGLKAVRKIEDNRLGVDRETKIRATATLQNVFYRVKEFNYLEGHQGEVYDIAFSPNNRIIASASEDGTVKLWNIQGELVRTLESHQDEVHDVVFSPDEKIVASASRDGTVKLWNLRGKLLYTLEDHTEWVKDIIFSPNGQTIASASDDGTVKIWNLQGQLLHTFKTHKYSGVQSITFSPDGQTIVASGDKTVKLWNPQGKLLRTIEDPDYDFTKVIFHPNGQIITSVSGSGVVKLWNLEGKLLHTLQSGTDGFNDIVFSPDGKTLASIGHDKTVKLWNLEGRLLRTLEGHVNYVHSLAFSPDGQSLASASWDHTVRIWNLDGELLHTLKGHYSPVYSLAFSPDSQTLASAGAGKTIKLWNFKEELPSTFEEENYTINLKFSLDSKTIIASSYNTTKFLSLKGKLLKILPPLEGATIAVSLSPDNQIIATGGRDGIIKLWNINGELLHTLKSHTINVFSVDIGSDNQIVASGSRDGTIKLWKIDGNGELLHIRTLRGHTNYGYSVDISSDGKTVVSGSKDGTVKLWSIKGELLKTLRGHSDSVNAVQFSPNSQIIASASDDRTVKLWSKQGQLTRTLTGHSFNVKKVIFSSDGQIIISKGKFGTIKLWNLKGQLIHTLEALSNEQVNNSMAISPNSKYIVSTGSDKIINLWTFDLNNILKRGCNWARDYLTNNPNVSKEDRKICDGIE